MRASSRALVAALAIAVSVQGARGDGTIDESGATITIGAGSPQGTKTVNAGAPAAAAPAIPPVGTLGTIGTFTSQLPAFPGGGTGADVAFTGSGAVASPGGTFNHTTYTVDAGAVVTYAGSVTIKTTGNVVINGTVTTTTAGASITFLCGGAFTMGTAGKVQSLMATSPILLDSATTFTTLAGAQVLANGDCEIRTHAGDIALAVTTVSAQAGSLSMRSSAGVTATGTTPMSSTNGALLIQAFGQDVALTGQPAQFGPSATVTAGAQPLTIEAANDAVFTRNVVFTGATGPISISAFGGDVKFFNAVSIFGGSGAVVRASAGVEISGTSESNLKPDGNLVITAFGGDVTTLHVDLTSGDGLTVEASGSVLLGGGTTYEGFDDVLIRAIGDRVELVGASAIGLVDIDADILDVRAATRITADVCFCIGSPNPRPEDAVSFSAGAGGITLGVNANVSTISGQPIKLTALGPVSVGGFVRADAGGIVVTSCDAGVTVAGGTIETRDDNDATGNITVQSFADAAGVIDLTGGTITTGDNVQNDAKSGDIKLLVHQGKTGGGGGPGAVSYDGFLLPKTVVVKTNSNAPEKSKITISGIFDFGTKNAPDPALSAVLDVGNAAPFNIPNFTPVRNGKALEHSIPGLLFRITLPKPGSSRGSFTLTRTADLANEINKDGNLRLHFVGSGIDVESIVTLAKGKYTLGKVRGKLIVPCVFPQSVAVTLRTPGQHKLAMVMGFETAGYDVTLQPCVKIGIGDTFTAEIQRADLTPKGQTLVFKGNQNGITDVKIDFAKEKITVKGKGMTLTGLPAGSGPVKITITLDTVALGVDERAVTVKMVRAGATLKY